MRFTHQSNHCASSCANGTTVFAIPVGPPVSSGGVIVSSSGQMLAHSVSPRMAPAPVPMIQNLGSSTNAMVPVNTSIRRDLSPRSMRKASHNAVEVRRRRRISQQLDRLKSMLNCPKVDKASLISEAVSRLHSLNHRRHSLETDLAHMKGRAPPTPSALIRAKCY